MGKEPLLSIIVTSYTTERLKDILELLDSIKAQTYRNLETILVIEKSTELLDRVKQYAEEKPVPNVRVVFNYGEPGLSAARNLGIKEARGGIMGFVDDDALLFPHWAEETVKAYANDDSIIGLAGPILPLWEDQSIAWFPREFYWILSCTYYDWTEPSEVRNGYGANMSFKRAAFDSGGLFLTHLGAKGGDKSGKHELVGDETELSIRVRAKTGKRILYHPKIKVQHKVYKYRVSPIVVARRAYWKGYTKAMFKRLFRKKSESSNVLATEHALLRRILFRLLPSILMSFFIHPLLSWRKLRVTVIVLFFVALGYLRGTFCSRTENTGKVN